MVDADQFDVVLIGGGVTVAVWRTEPLAASPPRNA